MKKIYLMAMAASLVLTACDPIVKDEGSPSSSVYTSDALNGLVTIEQVDENGNPASDGNYFNFTTSPATIISIFTVNDAGEERVIASGTSGSFKITPSRGSDPSQTFYIRTMNQDGSATDVARTVTVYVPQEMALDLKLAVSNSGSKVWKWDVDGSAFWGNMGYCGGAGADVALGHNGQWWGVDGIAQTFEDQQNHRGNDTVTGDDDVNAYMVWSEDGTIKCYNAEGTVIRTGTFEIQNFDNSDASAWKMGTLATSAGAILWPYEINSNGKMPTTFDLCYLTPDKMCLVYPDGGAFDGLGSWGEATFWHFASTSDPEGNLTGYAESGKTWTWDTSDGGAFWGNMGYCGGAGVDVYTSHNGQWWGVDGTSQTFEDQQNHRGKDTVTGDDDVNAYMVITSDQIKSFDATGKQIRAGYYTLDTSVASEWKVANLETDGGCILWPYEINSDGNMPTTLEMVYSDGSHMVLVYPDKGAFDGLGSWGEATFWRFMAK